MNDGFSDGGGRRAKRLAIIFGLVVFALLAAHMAIAAVWNLAVMFGWDPQNFCWYAWK